MILNGIQNGCHLSQQQGEGARGAHETITSITSQTHYHLLIRGTNAQTHQPSHKYTSTHTKPTWLPHLHHRGYCDINERISHPLHHLRNIHNRQAHYEEYIFRENTLAATSSHQPHHKSIRPNSLPTRTTHHLHNTTLKLRHMESHTPQPTQNSNAQILPAIPWDATQPNRHNHGHQHKHYIHQPITTCLHTKISRHNHH